MNKVLIVDDHPVIRLAVRMLMERHGYEVIAETDNGVDALQLAREHAPDIVILDIGIPKLDGLEVIARLSTPAVPIKVLVLTSQAPGHFSMRCMQAGAAGFDGAVECHQGRTFRLQLLSQSGASFGAFQSGQCE